MTRLALIGNGKWGKNYLKEAKKIKGVDIVYIRDHDWKDLLDKKDIDGIIIATPDSTHTEIINAFPDTYLLVEKPFTMSIEEASKIANKKIMVGYIYLYNLELQEQMKDIGQINEINFIIHNTEKVEETTQLWYLGSHAVSFALLHLGRPPQKEIKDKDGDLTLTFTYPLTKVSIDVGWNFKTEKRLLEVIGDKKARIDGTENQKITPLQNEIQAFVNFIHGTAVPSNLKHAQQVTSVLSDIESSLK